MQWVGRGVVQSMQWVAALGEVQGDDKPNPAQDNPEGTPGRFSKERTRLAKYSPSIVLEHLFQNGDTK